MALSHLKSNSELIKSVKGHATFFDPEYPVEQGKTVSIPLRTNAGELQSVAYHPGTGIICTLAELPDRRFTKLVMWKYSEGRFQKLSGLDVPGIAYDERTEKIIHVLVPPSLQRKGIGSSLLAHFLRIRAASGRKEDRLWTRRLSTLGLLASAGGTLSHKMNVRWIDEDKAVTLTSEEEERLRNLIEQQRKKVVDPFDESDELPFPVGVIFKYPQLGIKESGRGWHAIRFDEVAGNDEAVHYARISSKVKPVRILWQI